MGKGYPILRARAPEPVDGRPGGRSGEVGSGLGERNELGLAGICPVPGPLGVLHQGLDCATLLTPALAGGSNAP